MKIRFAFLAFVLAIMGLSASAQTKHSADEFSPSTKQTFLDVPDLQGGTVVGISRWTVNDLQCISAPGNPSSGLIRLYCDSGTGLLTCITSSGAACVGSGTGSVSSVSFTGGLISVGTPTSTPAFTVAGTSGGIPYFSSTSAWASSALLTTNILVKGGGAGNPPASSLVTDSGTQLSYTGTGGLLLAPASVSGTLFLKQGTAQSNGTTAMAWMAPTSVTSYILTVPSANPTNNNSGMLCSNAAPSVCAFAKMPQTAVITADYTNATTGFTSLTNLSFSVEASTNYHMHCNLIWSASAATAGPQYQITGPASPTALVISMASAITAVTTATAAATAFSTALNPVGTVVTTATNEYSTLDADIRNGVNAGTIQVQAAAQGAGTVTIRNGSGCQLQ